MRTIITVTAILLFLLSFFLPALDDGSGFFCAKYCAYDIWEASSDPGRILYYFPFTFSNLLMLILPLLLLTRARNKAIPMGVIFIQAILILHVLSWLVLSLKDGDTDIKIGYYIWLLSMCMILYVSIHSRSIKHGDGYHVFRGPLA